MSMTQQHTFVLTGGPTITGDHRQHHFATTHNDTYVGLTLPKIPSCEAVSISISIYIFS